MAHDLPFSSDDITQALHRARDPRTGLSLAQEGTIQACTLDGGRLVLTLAVPRESAQALAALCPDAARQVETLPGVKSASIVLTAHRPAGAPASAPPPGGAPGGAGSAARGGAGNAGGGHRPLGGTAQQGPILAGVKTVIAVASGKGGVGKSTTAVNLAVGLGMEGLKTGLMDADIHGPSLHRMLGANARPDVVDGVLQPVAAWGITAMSLGMLVDEKAAMIWRGPMVMGAVNQLLGDVNWGTLDVLVVDLPPGTGDAQLTLTQKVPLAGAVIVSTPQDIALIDARRAVSMFEKLQIPVLGLVENMSYFCCPNCGHNTELFGHGGARQEAQTLGVPFLGEVPLLADIRASGDAGVPVVIGAPESEGGKAWRRIAHTVAQAVRAMHRA
ncbi:Mrp/NBP35 family ATP-binding protein [Acetobacter sp. TBRC 12305]|uniref:Iron-sulfur cluster carrier protein n=1 Tax=Acetobacter garciniae TaxID=2817435 RepID=A0A939HHX6_9PROT|nr:Mrp/NBP35 family ATP-binding protein [Acetobacter garciniae]MBO1324710.1 Mrp/NBP35 family ATP-binding protein [Acetobacter garciniae]MBX0344401.1 Mrp/NBP35 family ATP-binding protein [Acetobacter garciniae]